MGLLYVSIEFIRCAEVVAAIIAVVASGFLCTFLLTDIRFVAAHQRPPGNLMIRTVWAVRCKIAANCLWFDARQVLQNEWKLPRRRIDLSM
jgi:hypothetical protein